MSARITGGFWKSRQEIVRRWSLYYQWEVLNDKIPGIEKSGSVQNFRIAAGKATGEFYGRPFQDSDLYKWLEAVGHTLADCPDATLESYADLAVDLIAAAQCEDGYLDTLYQIGGNLGKRWTNVRDMHELYCAGHLIEAATAYFQATRKNKILEVAVRLADHICSIFGLGPGQLRGYPGHEEIELALVKLYQVTGVKKYLLQASYFIEERGSLPNFFEEEAQRRGDPPPYGPTGGKYTFEYNQSHLPVRKQKKAAGHAVRALYLYCGMADVARETKDFELMECVRRLWKNVTEKQMYVTGAVGSSQFGEAFTTDYDLPNDTAYNETCASVALAFWARRMLLEKPDRVYSDVLERVLFNGMLAGMSLDGKRYFYVNPLEFWPDSCKARNDKSRTALERQPWFACSCCPTNVARLIANLSEYFYSLWNGGIWVHLFGDSTASFSAQGTKVELIQRTKYPWDGTVAFEICTEKPVEFPIGLRIPGWCRNYRIEINGVRSQEEENEGGYAILRKKWSGCDRIELVLEMVPGVVYPSPELRVDSGKVAVFRGPLIYCLEEADNGGCLADIRLESLNFSMERRPDLLSEIVVVFAKGSRSLETEEGLYKFEKPRRESMELTFVPYYAWNNRGIGEMTVWVSHTQE